MISLPYKINIKKICEDLRHPTIETEYRNPSTLILKHAKELAEVYNLQKNNLLNDARHERYSIKTYPRPKT